jgi:hypothetical protein
MSDKYILENKKPVPCDDLMTWAKWIENPENKIVKQTMVGDVKVSTVFLGLDHNFGGGGKPILFESMIFGGPHDQDQHRYHTWDEAERGHEELVAKVKGIH